MGLELSRDQTGTFVGNREAAAQRKGPASRLRCVAGRDVGRIREPSPKERDGVTRLDGGRRDPRQREVSPAGRCVTESRAEREDWRVVGRKCSPQVREVEGNEQRTVTDEAENAPVQAVSEPVSSTSQSSRAAASQAETSRNLGFDSSRLDSPVRRLATDRSVTEPPGEASASESVALRSPATRIREGEICSISPARNRRKRRATTGRVRVCDGDRTFHAAHQFIPVRDDR